MKQKKSLKTRLGLAVSAFLSFVLALSPLATVFADGEEEGHLESFGVSPTYQLVTLTPGETYESNFQIINPASSSSPFYFQLGVDPFTEDGNQSIKSVANGDYNRIVDWIELPAEEGVVAPNSSIEVRFKINVPENAPAGGQYAAITIASKPDAATQEGLNIHEVFQQTHLIYAEVSGETVRKGKINYVNVPSFLFTGNISGTAEIKNDGNVHSPATYTLQVFPLFSKEEVYTNEEDAKQLWVMPGNTSYATVTWKETPSMGIFHVIYNVEYEGVTSNVDKLVIVCPIWLLVIIVAVVVLLLLGFIFGIKRKK